MTVGLPDPVQLMRIVWSPTSISRPVMAEASRTSLTFS